MDSKLQVHIFFDKAIKNKKVKKKMKGVTLLQKGMVLTTFIFAVILCRFLRISPWAGSGCASVHSQNKVVAPSRSGLEVIARSIYHQPDP